MRGLSSLYVSERMGKLSGYFQTEVDRAAERLRDIDGLKKSLKLRGIDLDLDKLVRLFFIAKKLEIRFNINLHT